MIEILNLSKAFPNGKVALKNVSLTIKPGIFGLLGPNGAGKTTLMKILATLLPKTEGRVCIFGHDLEKNRKQIRSMLGYLPQQFGAYPNLSAMEFLDYMSLMGSLEDGRKRRSRIEEVLSMVNLFDHRFEKISSFSGGMLRRLGIAQALFADPKLIIVDEPTAGLDPEERISFRDMIDGLFAEKKDRVVILSTHIVQDISHICQQVGVLKQGELVFYGTPQSLAACGKGRVFEIEVDEEESRTLDKEYRIIWRTLGKQEGMRRFRVFGSNLLPGSEQVDPTIEEGYLAVIGGNADAV